MNRLIIYVESMGIFTKMFSLLPSKGYQEWKKGNNEELLRMFPSQIGEFKVIKLDYLQETISN